MPPDSEKIWRHIPSGQNISVSRRLRQCQQDVSRLLLMPEDNGRSFGTGHPDYYGILKKSYLQKPSQLSKIRHNVTRWLRLLYNVQSIITVNIFVRALSVLLHEKTNDSYSFSRTGF